MQDAHAVKQTWYTHPRMYDRFASRSANDPSSSSLSPRPCDAAAPAAAPTPNIPTTTAAAAAAAGCCCSTDGRKSNAWGETKVQA